VTLIKFFRLCSLVLVGALLISAGAGNAAAALPPVTADAAALFDLTTGTILGGKNLEKRVYPASTTKVLTALVVLEHAGLDESVSISERAQNQDGTSLYTRTGERYRLGDLMYAMLVRSANDAAVALAEHVAGTVEDFAALMNEKARTLGAADSNFVNPSGLPDQEHYTTAADMALIFSAAMNNPTIRATTATRSYTVEIGVGDPQTLINGNELLKRYSGTIGGKTGYTPQAGHCLLSAAARQGMQLGVALFGSQGNAIWSDAASLLDFGFENWTTVALVQRQQTLAALPVKYGTEALLVAAAKLACTVNQEDSKQLLAQQINLSRELRAPIEAGTVVGTAIFYLGGQEIGRVPVQVAHSVPRLWYTFWEVPTLFVALGAGWRFLHRVNSRRNMLRYEARSRKG
jgi:D-alanyl-D-alanine carboxypeptidase (penicillin-binding protein 5/6)